MIVVTGVSGSGKSEYAENRAAALAGGGPLYYVAAMEPYGEEAARRIRRHRSLRAGKGFTTLECYRDIARVPDMIGASRCREATVLVECMSNLLANEMFSAETGSAGQSDTEKAEGGVETVHSAEKHQVSAETVRSAEKYQVSTETAEKLTDKIAHDILFLNERCGHLVVVTNEVFADGISYEKETTVYIKSLGRLNRALVQAAEEAVEVVYTIPRCLKEIRVVPS